MLKRLGSTALWGAPVRDKLAALHESEFAPASVVRQLQEERLRALLVHAHSSVPYYEEILEDTGVVRGDGSVDLANFERIPLLTKSIIRERFEKLRSADLDGRQWRFNTSGGSTGEPVRFIQDREYELWSRAVKYLFDEWTGYRQGMPQVRLWGSERDLLVGRETIRVRAGRWLRNEVWLNSFRMTEAQMREHVGRINAHRATQILAYAESAYELARFIQVEGLRVWSPRSIMTSAGTLYPEMRRVIEDVFKAPVFNRYGSREVGDIACQCDAHAGLHISPLTHYVETLREDGSPARPGDLGSLVVTSLTNYAMPLIRYRIGDMGVLAKAGCPCGRSWPILEAVAGRTTDMFRVRNGTLVDGRVFNTFMWTRAWVRKYQFVQEDYDRIQLRVAPAGPIDEAKVYIDRERPELEDKVRAVMGGDCRLDIELVEEIAPMESGKYRYTISLVSRGRETEQR